MRTGPPVVDLRVSGIGREVLALNEHLLTRVVLAQPPEETRRSEVRVRDVHSLPTCMEAFLDTRVRERGVENGREQRLDRCRLVESIRVLRTGRNTM